MRDDFAKQTIDILAKRVSYRCSNPNCRKPTSGPREDPTKAVNVGVAAHVLASARRGPLAICQSESQVEKEKP